MTRASDTLRAVKDMVRAPFTFPGGYRKALLMADGETLCAVCAKENYSAIAQETIWQLRDTWQAETVFIHWEGEPLHCVNCNEEILSEYGIPNEAIE